MENPGPFHFDGHGINGPEGKRLAKVSLPRWVDGKECPEFVRLSVLFAAAPELAEALEDAEFLLRKAGQLAGPLQDSFNRSSTDARNILARLNGWPFGECVRAIEVESPEAVERYRVEVLGL